MSDRVVDWQPPGVAVTGGGRFPVRHIWCVGRNYAEHAREMGEDPDRSEPVFFAKPAQAVDQSGRIAYPPETMELHHEVELVVFLGKGGRNVTAADWPERIFGYSVGVDLTRRDVQSRLKKSGQPWEISKGFDQSAPVGVIMPSDQWSPSPDTLIELQVNGVVRQQASLGEMIWSVGELLERLSRQVSLKAGDVVFTGTPAGVSALKVDDRIKARVQGLIPLEFTIGAAASAS
jgi:fumarylpyruvate hydrolase